MTGHGEQGNDGVATPAGPPGSPVAERRPADIALLVLGVLGMVFTGLWSQSGSDVDTAAGEVLNRLPDALEGVAQFCTSFGSVWAVAIVVVVCLLRRRLDAARDVAVASGAAALVAVGLHHLLGVRTVAGITVRTGSGPVFPVLAVAVASALAVVLAPYLARPLRILLLVAVTLTALASLYLGTGLPSDVWGGLFLGLVAGAGVHVAFGAPGGRPTAAAIRAALEELGLDVLDVTPAPDPVTRATVMDVRLGSGDAARVVAYGRDQRDAQLAARVWHTLMYKAPGAPAFGSRLQQVEHAAYALVLAARDGVRVPAVVASGLAGPDAALLVTVVPTGRPLAGLSEDELTDVVLGEAWTELRRLHDAGIAHGALDLGALRLDDDRRVGFTTLGAGPVGAQPYWRDRDVASLLVATMLRVGHDRAIEAAVHALGKERVGAAIPLIQPAGLPRGTGRGVKHLGKELKAFRADVATATGAEDVPPLKVKRLSLVNIGMLAGILLALAIAIPGLEGVDWHTVSQEFQDAIWAWAVVALLLWPTIPMAWATALMGCVVVDLPFVPTVLVQVACSFLNLITPNGIGGTALQLDYLHHEDVPVASGASAMVLSTGVGGAIQVILFVIALALSSTKVDTSNASSGGTASLWIIALVAALVGVVLWVPKVRSKVVPAVKRAANDIWTVVRNPRKGLQLVGGDTAGNLLYPALLGLCLLAFHEHLSFAQLMVVQIGAGMLGNVAPVPGGVGVQEAALTAGLTTMGIPAAPALATVIVFRGITFVLPPIIGFFTLRWLRRAGYA